jgi:D-sedoheptulose 7-phosphate isomerase
MNQDEYLNAKAIEKLRIAMQEAAAMHDYLAESCAAELSSIATLSANCLREGGRLFFCGNGGSAAECQHLATEFVVRLSAQRERQALAAIALTTDTSLLTACSNDYGFDQVFSRQIEALLRPGDVLILLSTSGRSQNLILAAEAAQNLNGKCVGFLGMGETPLDRYLDYALRIPSASGQRVQEAHLLCGHLLVELIEELLFTDSTDSNKMTR